MIGRCVLVCLLAFLLCRAAGEADLRQGLIALQNGDLAAARKLLEEVTRMDPKSGVAWVALAQTYQRSGEKDLALEAAERAGKHGEGMATVEQALTIFYTDYGQALLQQGLFADALAVLEKGRSRFPRNPQIVLSHGVACYGQRRFEDSVSAFLEVIKLDTSVEQPYVFLGRILEHAGPRLPEVIAAYAAWEKRAPDNYLPPFLHAKALDVLPVPDDAAIGTKLRRSIELNAAFWESQLEVGVLFLRQGKYPEAEQALSRSIELNPRNAATHYQLARTYQRLGKPDLARAERAEYEQLKKAEDAGRLP